MNRIEVDAALLEHRQQRAQRTGPIQWQKYADKARLMQICEQVAQTLEGIATFGYRPLADIGATVLKQFFAQLTPRGIVTATHQIAQCVQMCRQSFQHRCDIGILELDVLIDRRIPSKNASRHCNIQFVAD